MSAFAALARAAVRGLAPDVSVGLARVPGVDVYRAGGGCHLAYLDTVPAWGLSVRHRVELALDRASARRASIVVANAPAPACELVERYSLDPARVRVVPNGVDAVLFRPDPETRAAVRRQLGVAESTRVALFLGDGFRRKGLATALEAAARVPGLALWVAGGGREAPWARLARHLGADARFLGHRGDPERLLAAADALVLPTRYDAAANVVLEAMACGIPAITSGADGARAFLPEPWMAVQDPEDAGGFAQALVRALDTPGLGARCRTAAEAMPWSHTLDAMDAILSDVVRDPRGEIS
jgi:UDP-glucose:(heptosyl)LPS alpha-1,3-glucosyltransferase